MPAIHSLSIESIQRRQLLAGWDARTQLPGIWPYPPYNQANRGYAAHT